MNKRVTGVLTFTGAVGSGGSTWDFMATLCPWRLEGGPLNRGELRILVPMESKSAASRMDTRWRKSEGAVVSIGVGRLKPGAKNTRYDFWAHGQLPLAKVRGRADDELRAVLVEKAKRRKATLRIPGLGTVAAEGDVDFLSKPIRVKAFDGRALRVLLEGYRDDPCKEDFHTAVANLLSRGPEVLKVAGRHVFAYYQDCRDHGGAEDEGFPAIASQSEVWKHVSFGDELHVRRNPYGDHGVYVSLSSSCGWEQEHGLQLVLKNGMKVTKVGEFDGHLTNSAAYDDMRLDKVVYRPMA